MAMTFINDIENCKKWVSPETLAKFATFFNVPVSEFFAVQDNTEAINPQFFAHTMISELHKAIASVEERFNV